MYSLLDLSFLGMRYAGWLSKMISMSPRAKSTADSMLSLVFGVYRKSTFRLIQNCIRIFIMAYCVVILRHWHWSYVVGQLMDFHLFVWFHLLLVMRQSKIWTYLGLHHIYRGNGHPCLQQGNVHKNNSSGSVDYAYFHGPFCLFPYLHCFQICCVPGGSSLS